MKDETWYEKIGYKCFAISCTQKINIDILKKELEKKTIVTVGLSGTGKSS